MTDRKLPAPFQDLEPYLEWALPSERERSAKRQSSTFAALATFYNVMLPRMDDVLPYLARFALDTEDANVRRLFHLALALAEVAPAVENFGQPSAVDGYDVGRFVALHE